MRSLMKCQTKVLWIPIYHYGPKKQCIWVLIFGSPQAPGAIMEFPHIFVCNMGFTPFWLRLLIFRDPEAVFPVTHTVRQQLTALLSESVFKKTTRFVYAVFMIVTPFMGRWKHSPQGLKGN